MTGQIVTDPLEYQWIAISEKAQRPLSISLDVSHFHSVSRKFIYHPMYIYNGQIFFPHYQPNNIIVSHCLLSNLVHIFIYYIFELEIFESQLSSILLFFPGRHLLL